MNMVRNSARLINTEFGGVCCKPMAERRSESTTTIRVKLVTMTRMLGARLRIVVMAMIWMRLELSEELAEPIETFKGSANAKDGSAKAKTKNNTLKTMRIYLEGNQQRAKKKND